LRITVAIWFYVKIETFKTRYIANIVIHCLFDSAYSTCSTLFAFSGLLIFVGLFKKFYFSIK